MVKLILKGQTDHVAGLDIGTIINGTQFVDSGEAFNATVNAGGLQEVTHGAGAVGTTINADGMQQIESGGVAYWTTINTGGLQGVAGRANQTTINSAGGQYVFNHGEADDTTLNGGTQTVGGGGVAFNTTVNAGGLQDVFGATNGTDVHAGGTQIVEAEGSGLGLAGYTHLHGGVQKIMAGGAAAFTSIENGGIEYDFGSAVETDVGSGGKAFVFKGAVATDTTIESGGTLTVFAGGKASGITFAAGGGTLDLFSTDAVVGVGAGIGISGWQTGDKIDLRTIKFGAGTKFGFSENAGKTAGVLTISDGSTLTKLTLLGQYTNADFALASDGAGGTLVTHPLELSPGAGGVSGVIAASLHAA